MGGLVALFGTLYESEVRAVLIRGGLVGYRSILDSPFCYVPYDSIIPGALTAGDLKDVAAALAPRAVRLEGLVDALNRRVPLELLRTLYAPETLATEVPAAAWLLNALNGR